jgi:hypothetical protein
MCTLPPLPPLAPVLPWETPIAWAIWLGLVACAGYVWWMLRAQQSPHVRANSRTTLEWALLGAGVVSGYVFLFAHLIVFLPAQQAFEQWMRAADRAIYAQHCAFNASTPLTLQRIHELQTLTQGALVGFFATLLLVSVSAGLTRRRRGREQAQRQRQMLSRLPGVQ